MFNIDNTVLYVSLHCWSEKQIDVTSIDEECCVAINWYSLTDMNVVRFAWNN